MAQGSKRYVMEDTSGGVCQFEELARPNQLANASNLWSAPDGLAETRPGYVGIGNFSGNTFSGIGGSSLLPFVCDVNGNAFSTVVSGETYIDFLTANAVVYFKGGIFGILAKAYTGSTVLGGAGVAGTITNVQYWNGTEWRDYPLNNVGDDYVTQCFARELQVANALGISFRATFPYRYFSFTTGTTGIYNIGATSISSCAAYRELVYQGGKNAWVITNYDTLIGGNIGIKNVTASTNIFVNGPKLSACQAPSFAVVPEFNTAFMAYGGTVYELPFGGTARVADVERRDEIIYKIAGIKSPYYDGRDNDVVSAPNQPGFVPQLNAYPAADYVLYHQGQVFLAQAGKTILTWSGVAQDGAYKVFPAYAFENISTSDDDSGITGIAAFQENVAVFKRDSIWLAQYAGLNFLDLPMYTLLKVVSGVGAVSNASIQLINGMLYFQAEDGYYRFTGSAVEKLSIDIDQAFKDIDVNNTQFASAGVLPHRNTYVCAVKLFRGKTRLFCYDYNRNAWWFWDDVPAIYLSVIEDGSDNNILAFSSLEAGVYTMTSSLDQMRPIRTYLQTWRIGDDGVVKTFRAARVNMDQTIGSVVCGIQVSDEDPNSYNIDYTSSAEAVYGTAIYGTSTYGVARRRERRLDVRQTGRWIQMTFSALSYGAARYWRIVTEAIFEGMR